MQQVKTFFLLPVLEMCLKRPVIQFLVNLLNKKKNIITPPLTAKHKERRLDWAKKYMRTNPNLILFTDECRATLNGPDGWSKGWVFSDDPSQMRLRRQQGGGRVMFWAGIVGGELIGPVKVQEGVKLNSFMMLCLTG